MVHGFIHLAMDIKLNDADSYRNTEDGLDCFIRMARVGRLGEVEKSIFERQQTLG